MSDQTLDDLIEEITTDEEPEEPTKRLNVELPKSLHQDFKAACSRQDVSMSGVVKRFVEAWVAKHL
jgi:predicted HicB family RNase H-like nuclease